LNWLFDEMLAPECASRLCELGHDALSVHDIGLAGHGDEEVFSAAISQGRVLVTENFGDFSVLLDQHLSHQEPCVPVVFLHRSRFGRGGSMANKVTALLGDWARDDPEPYLGPHWPKGAAED
jgi:predicted nuclease of predicted toxin-antitoxin system